MSDIDAPVFITPADTSLNQNDRKTIKFPVDFAMFIYFFNYTFTSSIFLNQISYQICTTIILANETDCNQLEFSLMPENNLKPLEDAIQPYTTKIKMTQQMLENILPVFLSFFLGPWSDTFGRKPLLLSSNIGVAFFYATTTALTILSHYYTISPWYYLIGSLGIALSGGSTASLIGTYAYIADTTKESSLEKRMGYISGALYIGCFIGSLLTSFVLRWTSPTWIFAIATVLQVISVAYIILLVEESRNIGPDLPTGIGKLREIFKMHLVVDSFVTSFKRRKNMDRTILWLVIGSLVINVFAMEGISTIVYLFVRERFNWTIMDFSLYCAFSILAQCIGLLIGSPILLKLSVSGTVIALLAYISYFINYMSFGFAKSTMLVYIIVFVTFLQATNSPMCRAIVTKLVHSNDVGKVFSVVSSLESITPIFAAPLFSLMYQRTYQTSLGAVMYLAAGISFLCTIIFGIVIILKKRYYTTDFRYESLQSEA